MARPRLAELTERDGALLFQVERVLAEHSQHPGKRVERLVVRSGDLSGPGEERGR